MEHKTKQEPSLYEQIESLNNKGGLGGLVDLLMNTQSFPMSILTMPYNLVKYGNLLKETRNLHELYIWHADAAMKSRVFAVLSPSYEKVRRHIQIKYEIL
jgi:hypothetical protein